MNAKPKQIPIDFPHIPLYERQDFMVAESNSEAIQIIDKWPEWQDFAICIYGTEGSGKTHLAHIFMENIYNKTKHPYKIPLIHARDIKLETVHRLFEESKCIVVENLSDNINEEAMFHLYNLYKNEGGTILFTSSKPPAKIGFKLLDLKSRLSCIPAIELKAPDTNLLSAVIVKLFNDRQVSISPEIINYIINNARRSFSYIKKLVEEADAISIAGKRAISIPIIKNAINLLEDNKQEELL